MTCLVGAARVWTRNRFTSVRLRNLSGNDAQCLSPVLCVCTFGARVDCCPKLSSMRTCDVGGDVCVTLTVLLL